MIDGLSQQEAFQRAGLDPLGNLSGRPVQNPLAHSHTARASTQTTMHSTLNNSGALLIDDETEPKAIFSGYGNSDAEVDLEDGVVVRVRILRPDFDHSGSRKQVEGSPMEFSRILDENGILVDSFWNPLPQARLQSLTNRTIRTPVKANEKVALGDVVWGPFKGHANEIAAFKVENGLVLSVQFFKSNAENQIVSTGTKEFTRVYDLKGNLLYTYNTGLPVLNTAKNSVVITSLNEEGSLSTLSFARHRTVLGHPLEIIAVFMQKGIVKSIAILNSTAIAAVSVPLQEENIKKRISFHLVHTLKGTLVGSFYSQSRIPIRYRQHVGTLEAAFPIRLYNGFKCGKRFYRFSNTVSYRGYSISQIVFGNAAKPGEITEFLLKSPAGEAVHINAQEALQPSAEVKKVRSRVLQRTMVHYVDGWAQHTESVAPSTPEEAVAGQKDQRKVEIALRPLTERQREIIFEVAGSYYDQGRPLPLDAAAGDEDAFDIVDEVAEDYGVTRESILESLRTLKRDLTKTPL